MPAVSALCFSVSVDVSEGCTAPPEHRLTGGRFPCEAEPGEGQRRKELELPGNGNVARGEPLRGPREPGVERESVYGFPGEGEHGHREEQIEGRGLST